MPLDDDARRRAAETKRDRTTAAIEAAAWRLLREGADVVTYKAVAESAQVSEATVYRYYPTKQELLESAASAALANEDALGLCRELATSIETSLPNMLNVWRSLMAGALEDEDKSEIGAALIDMLMTKPKLQRVSLKGLVWDEDDEPKVRRVSKEGLEDL